MGVDKGFFCDVQCCWKDPRGVFQDVHTTSSCSLENRKNHRSEMWTGNQFQMGRLCLSFRGIGFYSDKLRHPSRTCLLGMLCLFRMKDWRVLGRKLGSFFYQKQAWSWNFMTSVRLCRKRNRRYTNFANLPVPTIAVWHRIYTYACIYIYNYIHIYCNAHK